MPKLLLIFVLLALSACQPGSQTALTPTSAASSASTDSKPINSDVIRWSDASSWPDGKVPQTGEYVEIEPGQRVVLDTETASLRGLRVEGELVVDPDASKVALTADFIVVQGLFEIGTRDAPYVGEATITLTGDPLDETPFSAGIGNKVLGVLAGGRLELHSQPRVSWTKLARSAQVGATQLVLADNVDWQAGDEIVLASTDYDFTQAENLRLTGVQGEVVSLDKPLKHLHWGELQQFGEHTLDERAEVGLLTHGVTVQGDKDSQTSGLGGHLIVTRGGSLHAEGVSFRQMGQRGLLGRYPVHFHLLGDASGSYLRSSTIWESYNRCVTLHGSDNILIENNVAYEARGHCFFIEDGNEQGNVLRGNLGLLTLEPRGEDRILATDAGSLGPATFWSTNPGNVFENNVAAGSAGSGFWLAFPEAPLGKAEGQDLSPQSTPLAGFSGNVAHSNLSDGLHLDGPVGSAFDYSPHIEERPETATLHGFTAYKNRNQGVWLRGSPLVLSEPVLADNGVGASFASTDALLRGGLIVGESANKGMPSEGQASGEDGRSLPHFWNPEFKISGFEFYDGPVMVEGTKFVNFVPNASRMAAALDYLNLTDFYTDPRNATTKLSFENAQAVHYTPTGEPADLDIDSGGDGYRSAIFVDKDGSVTGEQGASVVPNTPFFTTASCEVKTEWNASVCPETYLGLTLLNLAPNPADLGAVDVVRSSNVTHTMLGIPAEGPNVEFRTNVLAGEAYSYTLNASSNHWRVKLNHGSGSVQVSLPYKRTQVFVYAFTSEEIVAAETLEELNAATTAYYHDGSQLHLKLSADTALDICERPDCNN